MPVLIDSNVILDDFTRDPQWLDWSSKILAYYAEDFYIDAHAVVRGWSILTRDNGHFNAYFPTLHIITPVKFI
ncbi:hypothetical protein SAMN05216302_10513 [Nitrosomonas aestuarii]|uniref:PIN domain-containing protein n=1 Tax=Nitrosomonas aestuarii TaxID=52441 RepID=A0A1I4GDB0_9PROT|nr:hypothetical protein [Nitrosomonas aestuarii]SFL27131.1 hypothetical protein SAMN05216302_10513 [Nitrosomonas aestuarii]